MRISDWSSDVCSSDLVIERTVNRSTDPARQIGPRRLRQAKLPLHIGVGIDARDICALLLERGGPPRLHANARGPQRVAGDPGLVAGCCNPAIGRDRLDIKLRHLKPDICRDDRGLDLGPRSEEHTSELQSLMRISYAVFCLKKKKK